MKLSLGFGVGRGVQILRAADVVLLENWGGSEGCGAATEKAQAWDSVPLGIRAGSEFAVTPAQRAGQTHGSNDQQGMACFSAPWASGVT